MNKDNEINYLKMKLEFKRKAYNNLLISINMNTSLECKSKPNSHNNSYHKMFNNCTDSLNTSIPSPCFFFKI